MIDFLVIIVNFLDLIYQILQFRNCDFGAICAPVQGECFSCLKSEKNVFVYTAYKQKHNSQFFFEKYL